MKDLIIINPIFRRIIYCNMLDMLIKRKNINDLPHGFCYFLEHLILRYFNYSAEQISDAIYEDKNDTFFKHNFPELYAYKPLYRNPYEVYWCFGYLKTMKLR